jgi:ribosome-interacting GTPase 1
MGKGFFARSGQYRTMGLEAEIEAIEEEIAETPYNKSTEAHIGRLKSKLAQKKEKLENQSSAGGGHGYAVEKTGDATVALVGFPSVGKSTLINAMTNAESEVGSYEFTTLDVNPGMLQYRGANIQMLDVPGLIQGAAGGRGGGREVLSVVRAADLVVFLLSVFEIEQYGQLREELYENKIRLDREPPSISISKKGRGGIRITSNIDLDLPEDVIKEVLREHGYVNANVTIRENVDVDRLIDGIMDNRVYLPSIVAVNKADLIDRDYLDTVYADLREHGLDPEEVTFISAEAEKGLDGLKEEIWETLGLMRIYMDKPGRGVDYEEPLILPEGSTIEDAMGKLGGDFEQRFRFARVSGPSAKHDEQQVGEDHELADEDVLKMILRR